MKKNKSVFFKCIFAVRNATKKSYPKAERSRPEGPSEGQVFFDLLILYFIFSLFSNNKAKKIGNIFCSFTENTKSYQSQKNESYSSIPSSIA